MTAITPTGLTTDLRVKCLARLFARAAAGQSDINSLVTMIVAAAGTTLDTTLLIPEAQVMKMDLTAQQAAFTAMNSQATTEIAAITAAVG